MSFVGGRLVPHGMVVGRSIAEEQERAIKGGGYFSAMSNEYRVQMASPPTSNFSAGLAQFNSQRGKAALIAYRGPV